MRKTIYFNRRVKIIISFAVILAIFLLILPHTSFFSNWVKNTTRKDFLIYAIIFVILGIVNGIVLFVSKPLKKRENHIIKVILLIRYCLLLLILSVATLILIYVPMSPDVEFVVVLFISLYVPIAGVISIVALVRWMKSKKESESPIG